jgi:uncharacterized protein YeaC (DUF1315 family)
MQYDDKRNSPRVRSFLRGEIIHSHGSSKTECTIRDLSGLGARIEAPPSVTVPEFFELFIPQKELRFQAQIVWRHNQELGLSFANETASQPVVKARDEVKMRMLELESEVSKLRAQLAEMKNAIETIAETKRSA